MPTAIERLLAALPNGLCYFRIAGSMVMLTLAVGGRWAAMWSLLVLLLVSDLIDGKLARHLRRTSRYGALLDTAADLILGGCLVLAMFAYAPETMSAYAAWIMAAVAAYALNVIACALKFQRFTSYHTRLAKCAWLGIVLAVFGLWSGWSGWLVLPAALFVLIANVEGILITLALPAYRVNVPSLLHVLS